MAKPKTGPTSPASTAATSGDVAKAAAKSKGGRPPNTARRGIRQQDEAIAAAVTTMWALGWPRRDACKAVAAAATGIWSSRDLSADGVEAIHERCSDAYGSGRAPKLGRIDLAWRRDRASRASVDHLPPVEMAAMLLVRQGLLPEPPPAEDGGFLGGDAPLTAGAHRDYLLSRIKVKKG
ncbi:hypothetical protein [Pseudaquabacterium pictum]|uniref:Uncharacterized protein n=1 Tax=Pseudaquabacterium pictum TaxID=2315236 RepID=A0A480AU59_9BURK|nr:hypothetical protein [Rubrivivax pictus]GCL64941.1 hypothetical protein AQPW35_40220 [Rubrivivax pictus]